MYFICFYYIYFIRKYQQENKKHSNECFLFCTKLKKNEPSRASTKWGNVVEEVRTVFEKNGNTAMYIPSF